MSDLFNGLMTLPNLIALLPCIRIVKKLTKEYELENLYEQYTNLINKIDTNDEFKKKR